jgi:hypothetical protein
MAAAEHARTVADLVDGTNDADRTHRIRGNEHEVRVGGRNRAYDGRVIDQVRRVAVIVYDLEPELFDVFPGPGHGGLPELGVFADDRHGARARFHGHGGCEETKRQTAVAFRAVRQNLKIPVVFELVVNAGAEQRHVGHLFLHHDRHRCCNQICGKWRDDEVDLVEIEKFRIDARDQSRVALVVVVDELDRATEQTACLVDLVPPDFAPEQKHLACGGAGPGERHAEPDLDRLGSASGRKSQSRAASGGSLQQLATADRPYRHRSLLSSLRWVAAVQM